MKHDSRLIEYVIEAYEAKYPRAAVSQLSIEAVVIVTQAQARIVTEKAKEATKRMRKI